MTSYVFAQRGTSYVRLTVSSSPVCLRTMLTVVISKDYQHIEYFIYIIESPVVFLVFMGYFILFGPLIS